MLLAALIVAVVMRDAGPAGPSTGRVAVGPLPASADALYAEPHPGLSAARLVTALAALGFEGVMPRHEGVQLRVPEGTAAASLGERLAATGLVRSVEADAVVAAARLTDDPLLPNHQQPYLDAVRAPEAWERSDGADVLIAVVDTGVDWNHPDLVDRIFVNERESFLSGNDDDESGCPDDIAGCNFVTLSTADPSCGYVQSPPNWRSQDDEGHGTFVAGVAAATGDNATGIAGVAWRAQILPVKVLDCTATGRISDAVAGIRYAARMGADVINISFGTPNDSPALREAVAFAQAQDAVIVASAGNDGSAGVTFPARYPGVISVAASGVPALSAAEANAGGVDGLAPSAINYATTAAFARFGEPVDFLAPGVGLTSTVPVALCERGAWICLDRSDSTDGAYASGSGSSYATPMVAGAVALVIAAHPERSGEFAAALLLAAREFRSGEPGGLLDVAAAVESTIYTGGIPGTSRDGGVPPEGSQPALEPRD